MPLTQPACKNCVYYDASDPGQLLCLNEVNYQPDTVDPTTSLVIPNPDWYCAYFQAPEVKPVDALIELLQLPVEVDTEGVEQVTFPWGRQAKASFKPESDPYNVMQFLTLFFQLTGRAIGIEPTNPLGYWLIKDNTTGMMQPVGAALLTTRLTSILLTELRAFMASKQA